MLAQNFTANCTHFAQNSSTMLVPILFGSLAALATCVVAQSNASQVLVVDQKSFNVLTPVPPPSQANLTTVSRRSESLDEHFPDTLPTVDLRSSRRHTRQRSCQAFPCLRRCIL